MSIDAEVRKARIEPYLRHARGPSGMRGNTSVDAARAARRRLQQKVDPLLSIDVEPTEKALEERILHNKFRV